VVDWALSAQERVLLALVCRVLQVGANLVISLPQKYLQVPAMTIENCRGKIKETPGREAIVQLKRRSDTIAVTTAANKIVITAITTGTVEANIREGGDPSPNEINTPPILLLRPFHKPRDERRGS